MGAVGRLFVDVLVSLVVAAEDGFGCGFFSVVFLRLVVAWSSDWFRLFGDSVTFSFCALLLPVWDGRAVLVAVWVDGVGSVMLLVPVEEGAVVVVVGMLLGGMGSTPMIVVVVVAEDITRVVVSCVMAVIVAVTVDSKTDVLVVCLVRCDDGRADVGWSTLDRRRSTTLLNARRCDLSSSS